ncbi:hypothetical protein GGR44_001225 [Sphingobium fontiphilum]|uniref:Uncharacterized protein n=1 Tax=Sphingobium fontiphilum TaxID=944425 RepID=A0A7W6DEB1_9SPHN|nr:hypothetical protein [Sphingobium fontiphilum]
MTIIVTKTIGKMPQSVAPPYSLRDVDRATIWLNDEHA